MKLELGDGKWDVICDAHQLEGALMNLSINARDAMADGGDLTISVADRKVTVPDLSDPEGAKPEITSLSRSRIRESDDA